MKLFGISAKLGDLEDLYLLSVGSLCGVLIVAVQCYRNELQLDPIRTVALLLTGFAVFFFLRRRCVPAGFRLAFIGTVFLILAYLSWPNRLEWPTWHDQGHYIRMTDELSHGYLTTDGFRMGLGYPLITVPFYLLIGKDALFIPNLAAFAGTLYFSYLLFNSLTNELLAKISVLFIIFATTLPYHHVIWWNHGITIFCLIALSYLAINSLTNTRLMLAGFLVGLAFFTRYLDVLVFLPILIYIIWHSKSPKFKGLILTLIAAIPFIIAPFVAHWLVFGDPLMSPYRTSFTSPLRIFQPEKIPYHFFLSFLYFPEDISVGMEGLGMLKMTVLIGAFYMIFAPLGAYLLHKSSNKKNLIMGMVASIVVCVLYSSSFWQFHSGTFGQFPADFRYLLLVYPYMVLFSVVGLSSFLKIYQRKTAKTNNERLKPAQNVYRNVLTQTREKMIKDPSRCSWCRKQAFY